MFDNETTQSMIFVTGALVMYALVVYIAYALSAIAHHVWL
jgi:hypothetical protein